MGLILGWGSLQLCQSLVNELYYTLYNLKETLRDQCTPTQKVVLLLFIINPLIQENTNNVVKGTSNEAFCLFKIGFD